MTIAVEKVLYTARATAEGGREGHTASDDGKLDVTVAPPKEMGGNGQGTNPEQLFAAGFASCFHSALKLVARKSRQNSDDSTVTAAVGIGPINGGATTASRSSWSSRCRTSSAPSPRSWWPRLTRSARTPTPPAATSRSTSPSSDLDQQLTAPAGAVQAIRSSASASRVWVEPTGAAAMVSASMIAAYSSRSSSLSR